MNHKIEITIMAGVEDVQNQIRKFSMSRRNANAYLVVIKRHCRFKNRRHSYSFRTRSKNKSYYLDIIFHVPFPPF
jgi:hypothetical protein